MIKPRSLTSLSFTFPCYNEAKNIGGLIEQAVKVGEEYGVDYEIIVVNDGSQDDTAAIVSSWSIKNPRVRLVSHPQNKGYGAAVRTCLESARKDYILLADGDNQFQISDIEKLFSVAEGCDAVVGYRIARRDTSLRRLKGRLWTGLVRLIFGLKVHDVDCAFKLFRRKSLEGMPLESNHLLIHAEILARLKKKGCRVAEIGIPHHPRTAGKASAVTVTRILKTFGELVWLYGRIR